MKEGFMPKKGKVYPLSREEREEMREFIQEQLKKEYIRPSKSSQIVPVFFIGKKDGKKWIVQNYRYLNEWTTKNNYPSTINIRCSREYRYEKSIYKDGPKVGVQ